MGKTGLENFTELVKTNPHKIPFIFADLVLRFTNSMTNLFTQDLVLSEHFAEVFG